MKNPKAVDVPQINLVLDAGLKGQKIKSVSPDTNRTDPVGGAALGSLQLLMFPKSAKCLVFEAFALICAGLFTRSLVLIQYAPVWLFTGLILLIASLYLFTAMLNHPQCRYSALSKLTLFVAGVVLSAVIIF